MPKSWVYVTLAIVLFYAPISITYGQSLQINFSKINQPSDFEFGSYYTGTKDFVELSYGLGKVRNKILSSSFNNLSSSEIIIGKRYQKPAAKYKLIEFNDNYFYSSFLEDYQENINENSKIGFDIWRFGFGYRKGFGYNLGSMSILPYYHIGIGWNKTNINLPKIEDALITSADLKTLKYFDDEIKFGTSNIGGLDVRVSSTFGIGASYETSVIFPYYKTWKQLGSFFIETFSQTGIDFLTEGVIIKAIPELTPILYFVLKNGLSYYLFTLKKDDMNWPFRTTAPLTVEAFKVSLNITF